MNTVYLSKQILKNKSLTPTTKLVAHHLFHISGWEKEQILPSQRKISKSLNISVGVVNKALASLVEEGYLTINENTFTFKINNIEFTKSDLSNKELCEEVGHFVVVPTFALYCDKITPAQKDAYFKFFDFYFGIKNNHFYIKNPNTIITLKYVSDIYGDNDRTFREHIENIKKTGMLEYNPIMDGSKMKLIGVKVFDVKLEWVVQNGKPVETKEETVEEVIEEETVEEVIEVSNEEINELVEKLPLSFKREYEVRYSYLDNQIKKEWLLNKLTKLNKVR